MKLPKDIAASAPKNGKQTLLIDLDDTLCENNIYFERAIAKFISLLDHKIHTREEVRLILNKVEHETILTHGYGLQSFTQSLITCFEQLSVGCVSEDLHATIRGFAHTIAEHPVELIRGVPETLEYLSARHHLIIMTKGSYTEQIAKVERSGIQHHFSAVEVVAEKKPSAYRELIQKYSFDPSCTWMVGNSPKSDINPALAAGLHAIFIPHDQTWVLEHEALASAVLPEQQLLKLDRFSELANHF